MMHTCLKMTLLMLLALGLGACSERDQSLNTSASKADGQPWQGAQNHFIAPGYEPGDKTRWETQMRQRAQTQNEYVRAN